jgi:hypothetical protein
LNHDNFACHDAVDAIVTRNSHITVSTSSKSYVKSISCEIHPHLQDGGSICSSISDSSSVSDSSNSSVADRSSCHCVIAAIADRCCSHRVVAAIADWCCSHCAHFTLLYFTAPTRPREVAHYCEARWAVAHLFVARMSLDIHHRVRT